MPRIHQADGEILRRQLSHHQEPVEQDRHLLSFVEIEQGSETESAAPTRSEVLDRLSRGELTVAQALDQLKPK